MTAFAAMTRDDVIDNYQRLVIKYDIPDGGLWLGGGSAMIMYGLRETTMDLDAGAHPLVFRSLAKQTKSEIKVFNISDGYLRDNTQLFALPEYSTDVHNEPDITRSDICKINGVWCYTTTALMAQKKLLAKMLKRDKDFADIARLEEYIKTK